jgi:ABC-type Zn uptake system ZnuABC Zn-binding protein ZnuA
MNGLGLDDWLGRLAADAGATAEIVRLGEDLPGVTYLETKGRAMPNPHVWLNVAYARLYVERIGDALARVDPAGASTYSAGVTAYGRRLEELDGWVKGRIAEIPEANREFVSFHDALPYFADAYGLTIVGTVVDAPGQDPSAGQVADLVNAIKAAGVHAVFSESKFSPELVRTIAEEAGATVVPDLYTDSLGDPPVDTFEGLIRWDTDRFVSALR